MRVDFQRTLRIPDDENTHYLPPGLGRFPLGHVDDYLKKLPSSFADRGGVFLPMYQSEALWINFHSNDYPFAVKVAAGKINAVTGDPWSDDLHVRSVNGELMQDYVVVPGQPWLDGFAVEKGVIRQFVAMPLGCGHTVEEQLTGEGEFGGVQIIAYPLKPELYRPEPSFGKMTSCLSEMIPPEAELSMGLGLGGKMKQEIFKDVYGISAWHTEHSTRCFAHIVNSRQYRSITGNNPPTRPPKVEEYDKAGLPWFDYYDENKAAQIGSSIFDGLDSVGTIDSPSVVGGSSSPHVITPGEPDSPKKDQKSIKKALVHRYDNKADILAVQKNGGSEVFTRATDDDFDIVIVVPTRRAETDIAVWGEATSGQYTTDKPKSWPGRPDSYSVRVDMKDIQATSVDLVKKAFQKAGKTWQAAWTVNTVNIDTSLI